MKLAQCSLAILWIATGLTSLFGAPEVGYQILSQANITGLFAKLAVWGGSLLDLFLGIWILTGYKQIICIRAQIATIILYSSLLTIIAPEFWLHPFGPLTKNLPILALLISMNEQIKNRSTHIEKHF